MRLLQRLLPSAFILTLAFPLAACSSSDSTSVIVGSESPNPVQTPIPQAVTPEGVAPTPEPVAAPAATPTEASDDAGLVWTEVDLADALGADETSTIQLQSVGDGRILALSFIDRGMNSILVTKNGREWAPISVPAGFLPWGVDIAGDRWLIQGWDSTLEAPYAQILFSDDEGANWTEIVVDLASFDGTAWVADAIVAGKLVVVTAQSDTWQPENDQALDDDIDYEPSEERVHLFLSEGGPAELVAEFPGWASGGHGASDGFHLMMYGPDGDQLLTSPDGREWIRTAVDVEVTDSARNEVWTSDEGYTEYRIERFEGVYGSGQVLTLPDGIGWVPGLAVGPAGVAMVGGPRATPSEYDSHKYVMGWSVDGTDWEWQTLQEAFGLPERSEDASSFTEVQVAVGQDFVLAQIQTFEFPEAEFDEDVNIGVGDAQPSALHTAPGVSASPHRWYIARVS